MALSHSPNIITNGLVLCLDAGNKRSYPGAGTTWYDLSGSQYNGTLTNGPVFDNENKGNISFDGTNDFADFGQILNFTTGNFTFNIVLYIRSFITGDVNNGPVIFYKGSYNSGGYYCGISLSGNVYIVTNQSSAHQVSSSSIDLQLNNWYCLSVVRNNTSCKIYINGIDCTGYTESHSNPSSSNLNFLINRYGIIYGNLKIVSFLTYNRALSAQEVKQNYNATRKRFGL